MTDAVALEGIKYPRQHDFLLGRGGETNNHSGNVLFRQFIRDCKEAYQTAPKTQKPLISQQLVAKWRNLEPPGRFLERCDDDKTWKDVGDAVACRKTSKALGERGKRSKSGDDPASPSGAQIMGGANLAGNKRKMDERAGAQSTRDFVLNAASLNAASAPSVGGPADVSSVLQRLTGGGAAVPALPESSISAHFGGASGNGAGGLDLASLLQMQQAPSPMAILLAQAQQQQQRDALLLGMLQQPGAASLQQQLLSSTTQGGGGSLASLLAAPTSAPPAASSTPLADALAAAMSNRNSASSGPTNNDQLLDIALARHILSSSSSNPPATASAHAIDTSLDDLLRIRQRQQLVQHALGGEEAKAPEAAAPDTRRNQAETFQLLQLFNNQNQLQGADPAVTLAALRRSLGNNY